MEQSAKDGIFADLWDKITAKPDSLASTTTVGVRKMFSDDAKYVAMSDQTSLLVKALREDRCDWAFMPELFYPTGFGLALPENSPYRDIFSQGYVVPFSSNAVKICHTIVGKIVIVFCID